MIGASLTYDVLFLGPLSLFVRRLSLAIRSTQVFLSLTVAAIAGTGQLCRRRRPAMHRVPVERMDGLSEGGRRSKLTDRQADRQPGTKDNATLTATYMHAHQLSRADT